MMTCRTARVFPAPPPSLALVQSYDAATRIAEDALSAPKYPWNADETILKTPDGFYGSIGRNDTGHLVWKVTPPNGAKVEGNAMTHVAAKAAIEHLISEVRARANG